MNKYVRKYLRSKKGLITKIYSNQKRTSIKRGYSLPEYSKEELSKWLFNQKNFEKLYNNRVNSGYDKYLIPSIDRINDYKGYSFNNIRLTTWIDNKNKGHSDRKKGINNKISKPILQIKNGKIINEYFSISEAERKTGIKGKLISAVCKKSAGGYDWQFKY